MKDHPMIESIERTGYPQDMQPETAGIDYFGDEILTGDDIVIDGEETILQSNLEEYLTEVYGFKFQTIK
jgi:hypothetical protein